VQLSGKTVLIAGGTSGMGFAVAEQAQASGARVIVASRSPDRVTRAARALGADAVGEILDVMDDASIERLWSRVGRVDHLVISAADIRAVALTNASPEDAHASMDSKFWGPCRLIRRATISPEGSVVLFSGLASRRPGPATGILSAINGAVEALGQALALELRPVRVNVICPGLIDTEFWDHTPPGLKETMFADAIKRLPVRRVGRPEEIGSAVMALLTNGFINGTVLVVDGGASLV
jgi:NAD(P)-dependent dehydrogenase (short-subunit alcohol dehydrogenase family)